MRHINGTVTDLRRLNGSARGAIELTFLRAIQTRDSLPDLERYEPHTSWPRFPHEWFAYSIDPDDQPEPRFVPTPADLSSMLTVLAWGHALDRGQWRIVGDRAAGFSWAAIGVRRHMPADAVQWHYGRALDAVVAAAMVGQGST